MSRHFRELWASGVVFDYTRLRDLPARDRDRVAGKCGGSCIGYRGRVQGDQLDASDRRAACV